MVPQRQGIYDEILGARGDLHQTGEALVAAKAVVFQIDSDFFGGLEDRQHCLEFGEGADVGERGGLEVHEGGEAAGDGGGGVTEFFEFWEVGVGRTELQRDQAEGLVSEERDEGRGAVVGSVGEERLGLVVVVDCWKSTRWVF